MQDNIMQQPRNTTKGDSVFTDVSLHLQNDGFTRNVIFFFLQHFSEIHENFSRIYDLFVQNSEFISQMQFCQNF